MKSRTSKTLLVSWLPGLDGGYPLQWFELVYINARREEAMIKVIACINSTDLCEHRIQNLTPNSAYT